MTFACMVSVWSAKRMIELDVGWAMKDMQKLHYQVFHLLKLLYYWFHGDDGYYCCCVSTFLMTTFTFSCRWISLLCAKNICRNVGNDSPCAHMWYKTQHKQRASVSSRSHGNSEALQGTNLPTLAKFPSHACCNKNLSWSHHVVTDRTLPHAGPVGEIQELLLTFPTNSIRIALGSRLCTKLRFMGFEWTQFRFLSLASSSGRSEVENFYYNQRKTFRIWLGKSILHYSENSVRHTFHTFISIYKIVFLRLTNGDLKKCGFLACFTNQAGNIGKSSSTTPPSTKWW